MRDYLNSIDKKTAGVGLGIGALVYAGVSWLVKKIFKLDEKNATKHINMSNREDVRKKLYEIDKKNNIRIFKKVNLDLIRFKK